MMRIYTRTSSTLLRACRQASSLISSEVEKFSKVGSSWWDHASSSGTGPLHYMNLPRIHFIRDRLAREYGREHLPVLEQIKGVKILDVGCGGGLASEALARLGADVTAIDPSESNISVARAHSASDPATASINYLHSTIEKFAETQEKFDVVISLEVVEHVNNPRNFISACASCLGSVGGGISPSLFLSTINRSAKSYLLAILGAEYLLRVVPPGTHEWSKFITPAELNSALVSCGLKQISIKGLIPSVIERDPEGIANILLSQHSVLKSWSLSDSDIDINYIVHAGRPSSN